MISIVVFDEGERNPKQEDVLAIVLAAYFGPNLAVCFSKLTETTYTCTSYTSVGEK